MMERMPGEHDLRDVWKEEVCLFFICDSCDHETSTKMHKSTYLAFRTELENNWDYPCPECGNGLMKRREK